MGKDIWLICNWKMTLLKAIIQTDNQIYESVKKINTTKYDVEETCYSSEKMVHKECSASSFLKKCKLNSIDSAVYLLRKSVLNIYWKDWGWRWNSNILATWYKELTHWKWPWCWERLKAGGEGDEGKWDGWMASPIQWTWIWVSSGSWWWTGRSGMLLSIGSQRVRHDWATELNWTY